MTTPKKVAKFWSHIAVGEPDACWEWTGGRAYNGYGQHGWRGKHARSHRTAYEISFGPIPPGHIVRHKCDNPPCCNPAHLECGTWRDNTQDCISRGRFPVTPRGATHHLSKLTSEQVSMVRESTASQTELAKALGVHQSTISNIRRGVTRRQG